ncbi:TetR/AcrR family transcriptional regulator [Sebaldella sp. S0638]|uniref:TetR/AcrR family transcriptional regulator n=1 Tax=Sebaldella sp. S0638 TaxID=2957809 RepID=UPI00209F703A|nr:helix-turn-helix domain-containing protein [Sebaldella sp. S0638]MCP1226432.1 TetR/AcrR family transcriptional regulator [Sebaldella sp. S0638]
MKDNGTKSKIIAAAEELFKQKDYEDIAIREICQLADISIGAFYRYMGSKEKLFKVFHVKMGTEIARLVLEQTDNKAPVDKIIIIINIYLDFI